MSGLYEHIQGVIAADGPISLARYMEIALAHPTQGYYITRDPLGAAGDFTTAPEVSQMFGEIIGLWAAHMWMEMGAPDPLHLVETGPGRGTLMADMVRAMRIAPGLAEAVRVHLVETSPALREKQKETLAEIGVEDATWHERLADVPDGPMLLVANEFLDALSFHQFEKRDGRWFERMVGMDEDGDLTIGLAPQPAVDAPVLPLLEAAEEGALFERSPQREAIAIEVAQRLARHQGAALFIDYGHAASGIGDTFQALKAHQPVDPLEEPGEADLTSHVDFEAFGLAAISAGAKVFGAIGQGDFLKALGIEVRAERLGAGQDEEEREAIAAALHRLVSEEEMGELFKVMILTSADAPVPPPFME